jgi:hypothetical protein
MLGTTLRRRIPERTGRCQDRPVHGWRRPYQVNLVLVLAREDRKFEELGSPAPDRLVPRAPESVRDARGDENEIRRARSLSRPRFVGRDVDLCKQPEAAAAATAALASRVSVKDNQALRYRPEGGMKDEA